MATISTDTTLYPAFEPALQRAGWTVADLLDQLGDIPPQRVHLTPPPGTATEKDVLEMNDHHHRLCELIDGTLVEKTMGYYEAWLAGEILRLLGNFVVPRDLGIVTGPDGFLRLFPDQVRAPDVTYIRRQQLPEGRVPRDPIPALTPTLAVEVLSPSNSRREMERKLREYFLAGTELVWYIEPPTRSATVYTSPDQPTEIGPDGVLKGGDVLAGFELPLRQLFSGAENG
jgi:Uma2 family endonuclease